jgi:hypothetical protein
VILAVNHEEYVAGGFKRLASLLQPDGVFVDVKSVFPVQEVAQHGHSTWRL